MNLGTKINISLFIILWPFVQIVIWITFFIALANAEMDLSLNKWYSIGIHLFQVFKWPTLFFYDNSYFPLFFVLIGLFINSLIYAFLIERLITVVRLKVKKYRHLNT